MDPAPDPDTGPTWAAFLRSQAEAIIACDFVVVNLLDGSKAYVLTVIEHATRRVRVLGATFHPTAARVTQQARNALMDREDTGARVQYLIHDRDASFGAVFDAVSTAAGIDVIRTGVQAPRQNAITERWFRSPRTELTDRSLIWNLEHLLRLLREYEVFYNGHRPHRSLGQAAPSSSSAANGRTPVRSWTCSTPSRASATSSSPPTAPPKPARCPDWTPGTGQDRIRCGKDTCFGRFPFRVFAINAAWLEWPWPRSTCWLGRRSCC